MRPRWKTVLCSLCWLICLSACAARSEPRITSAPSFPEAALTCPTAPTPPSANATQRDAALYLIALSAAHEACRIRLLAVRDALKAVRAAD